MNVWAQMFCQSPMSMIIARFKSIRPMKTGWGATYLAAGREINFEQPLNRLVTGLIFRNGMASEEQREQRLCTLRLIISMALLIGFFAAARRLPNFESSRFTPGLLAVICFTSFTPIVLSIAVVKNGNLLQKGAAAVIIAVAAVCAFFAQNTLRSEIGDLSGP
jgi:hypothetical protein